MVIGELMTNYQIAEKNRLTVRPKRAGLKAGFTLIEVLVAIFMIAFGCLVAIQMQVVAMGSGTQADNLTVASLLAETQMELFRSQRMTDLKAGATYLCCTRLGDCQTRPQNDACGGSSPYKLDTEIFSNEPTSRSMTLKVRVDWQDANGKRGMDYRAAITDYNF